MRNRQPKHIVVADHLRRRISSGHYPAGASLPGRRLLASEYAVAQMTIQSAIDDLVGEGLLRTENGRGTYVSATSCVSHTKADVSDGVGLGLVGILARVYPNRPESAKSTSDAVIEELERIISTAKGSSVYYNIYRPDLSIIPLADSVSRLIEHGVNGIVVVNEHDTAQINELISRELHGRVPIVFATGHRVLSRVSCAYFDNKAWGRTVARHLLERGCRRLLAFAPKTSTWMTDRIEGAREAIAESGLPQSVLTELVGSERVSVPRFAPEADFAWSTMESFEFASRAITADIGFDGVMAGNDCYALGFAKAVEHLGLQAGRDYALVGFDNSAEARNERLSSVQRPIGLLAASSIGLLSRLLSGEQGPLAEGVDAGVVVRHSSMVPLSS
ncbi:MAG TPA: GntR family transcriptional regulator [Capsulimonadaceae bacterium]|jgi:DNA-binding LacI/PurR family transcriptional regulator